MFLIYQSFLLILVTQLPRIIRDDNLLQSAHLLCSQPINKVIFRELITEAEAKDRNDEIIGNFGFHFHQLLCEY